MKPLATKSCKLVSPMACENSGGEIAFSLFRVRSRFKLLRDSQHPPTLTPGGGMSEQRERIRKKKVLRKTTEGRC